MSTKAEAKEVATSFPVPDRQFRAVGDVDQDHGQRQEEAEGGQRQSRATTLEVIIEMFHN